jgi:hypothetical protein
MPNQVMLNYIINVRLFFAKVTRYGTKGRKFPGTEPWKGRKRAPFFRRVEKEYV